MDRKLVLALFAGAVIGAGAGPVWNAAAARLSAERPLPGTEIATVPAFGKAPAQKAQFFAADKPAPLIVDLHQWGGDHQGRSGSYARLDELVRAKAWSFIRPDVVDLQTNCDPDQIADGVRAAISYAKANAPVGKVYVIGSSGGGYMALVAMMKGVEADGYQAWVPITDLQAWERQHRADRFGEGVRTCAGGQAALGSPLNMPMPTRRAPLQLYAGVDDGFGFAPDSQGKRYVGVVMPTHAVRFFNRFASEPVTADEITRLLEDRSGSGGGKLGDRAVLLERSAPGVSLTIFDGAHEMLADVAVEQITRGAP